MSQSPRQEHKADRAPRELLSLWVVIDEGVSPRRYEVRHELWYLSGLGIGELGEPEVFAPRISLEDQLCFSPVRSAGGEPLPGPAAGDRRTTTLLQE
jgi:hypothetical protein